MSDQFIASTELAEDILEIIAKEAQMYLRDRLYMVRLINRDYSDEVREKGDTVKIHVYGSMTPVDAADDGTPFETQKAAITTKQLTLDKHKIIPFAIVDLYKLLAQSNVMEKFIANTFGPLAEKVEDDIFALYSSFSNSMATSSTCTVLTTDDSTYVGRIELTKIRRQLNQEKTPLNGRYLIVSNHDEQFQLQDEKFVDASFVADQGKAIKGAYLGTRMGLNLLASNRIPYTDESTYYKYRNLAFVGDTIGLVTRPLNQPTPPGVIVRNIVDSDSGMVFRVIISYDHKALTWIISVDVLYGTGILMDDWGYVVTSNEAHS